MATELVMAIKTDEISVGGIKAIDVRGNGSLSPTSAARTTRSTTRARMSSARLLKKGNWLAQPSRARATAPNSTCGRGRCSLLRRRLPVKVYPVRVAGDALQIEV